MRQSSDGQVWLPGGGQVSEDLITPAATAAKRLAEAAATERAVSLTACSCSRDSPWGFAAVGRGFTSSAARFMMDGSDRMSVDSMVDSACR